MENKLFPSEYKKLDGVERKRNILSVLNFCHFCLQVAIFFVCWLLFSYHTLHIRLEPGFRYNLLVLGGYALVLFFFTRSYNAYLFGYSRVRTLILSQFISKLFSVLFVYVITSFAWRRLKNPLIFLGMIAVQVSIDALFAYFGNQYYLKTNPVKRTILVYRNQLDKKRFGIIQGKPSGRLYRVDEELQYEGHKFSDIRDKLVGFDAVFVAGIHSRCRNGILKYCKEEGIPGFFLPHVGDVLMQEAKHIQSFDSPVMFVTRSHVRPEFAIIKRAFDIIASALGLIILSPFMLITSLAIHFYDGGPVIYKQKRLTKDGKEFWIYKFRSMRVDAEKDGVARFSTGDDDDRITPVGKIIRKIRFDELPQLWNILRGDMSVVGPRPERPEIAEQFYKYLPAFKLRLQVKAGLTGYAQVYGRYNSDPYEKLEFDLMYINNITPITDLMLMFATFGTLFSSDSTQGFSEGLENLTPEEFKEYGILQEGDS